MVGRETSPIRLRRRWEERTDGLEMTRDREWGKSLKALRSPSPPRNYIQKEITVRRERATERLGLAFNDAMQETRITEVWNGPCKDAGVAAGMVIVAVDNQGTQTLSLLQRYLSEAGLVFTLSVEEQYHNNSPVNSQPVTPTAGGGRSIASYPPPTSIKLPIPTSTPITSTPLQVESSLVTTIALAPHDEVIQLRLQLEAANLQIRSTQSRLQSQSDLELERNEELVFEREKRQKLNTELILERTGKNEAEEEVRVLREHLKISRDKQTAKTADERHDNIRRSQLEEEIIILRNELQSLKQLLFHQSSGNRERELLLQCFDDERTEWNFHRQELESQLSNALEKCESMKHLKTEVEALTAAMQSPAPMYSSRDTAPVMSDITYAPLSSRAEYPGSVSSVAYDEYNPISVPKSYGGSSLLLSERLRAAGEGTSNKESISPQKPRSVTDNYTYTNDRRSKRSDTNEKPKVPSDLDDRLEQIASRARDAIAAAEQRAATAEQKASGLKNKLDRFEKDGRADTFAKDKLRENENRSLRKAQQKLGKDQHQLDKERKEIAAKDQSRRDLEEKMRQDQQRLERERNEQEKRWQDAERKAHDLEKRIASASAAVTASTRSPSPQAFEDTADLKKRAAAVFKAMCAKAGRSDTKSLPKTGIPEVLNCGDSWKVLFRGLQSAEGIVTTDLWVDWIMKLASESGAAESESRLEWVEEQLTKSRTPSPMSTSSFRGQTTRELAAEAKVVDRLNVQKPTNKYADWGYKPSTSM